MKLYAIACVLLVHQWSVTVALPDQQLDELFVQFKTKYNKSYNDATEEAYRRHVFADRLEYVSRHNVEAARGEHSFTVGINDLSDWTAKEVISRKTGLRVPPNAALSKRTSPDELKFDMNDLPKSVDWRDKGIVTRVKEQYSCGSCWAFGAVATLESYNALKTGKLVELSEQNLVDCSWIFHGISEGSNNGCYGGYPNTAFRYVAHNKGIDTEFSYPYSGLDTACSFNRSAVGAKITGYKVLPQNETVMAAVVANVGPLNVAIKVVSSFFSYRSGVYDDPDCVASSSNDLDHAITVVGYGTNDKGQDYWIVKNSWGKYFGMDGYILMARNKNRCGIALDTSYPTM
jgi:C1A family cysteine protease